MEALVESEEKMNLDEQEATSSAERSRTINSEKTEWTNEKHSMYLRSMETSFVNQLYDSLDSFGRYSRNKCVPDPTILRQKHSHSGQFKVFRDGNWTNFDVSRGEPVSSRFNRRELVGTFLGSPWIKHYTRGGHHVETSPNIQEEIPIPAIESCLSESQFQLHQESIDSITEVTDQNFVDGDLEAAETSEKMQSVKRMKTALVSDSGNDQVVPFGKRPLSGDDVEAHVHSNPR